MATRVAMQSVARDSAVAPSVDGAATPARGVLSIVPTPIGNPDDITLRALRVLRQVDLIAAEDPRVTRTLLDWHGILTPIRRCASAAVEIADVLAQLEAGASVALVCDAGTPTIVDPGAALVRAALARAVPVVALPGPTAVTVALAASGLVAHRFAFDGFPPHGRADRHEFFVGLASETRAIVLFESGSTLRSTLNALREQLGAQRRVAIAHELTGPNERVWRGTLEAACEWTSARRARGHCTIVVAESRK